MNVLAHDEASHFFPGFPGFPLILYPSLFLPLPLFLSRSLFLSPPLAVTQDPRVHFPVLLLSLRIARLCESQLSYL